MKEIMLMMENTSKPYIKYILYLYAGVIVLYLLLCGTQFIKDINVILNPLFTSSFFTLFLIHVNRYTAFMKNGGIRRIRLLPIKKTSFLCSEIVFQAISYLGLYFIHIGSWYLLYILLRDSLPFINNSFLYFILSNKVLYTFIPMNLNQYVLNILFFLHLSCISTLFLIQTEYRKSNRIFATIPYFLFIIIILLFITPIYLLNHVYISLILLVALFIYPILFRKYFLWGRR